MIGGYAEAGFAHLRGVLSPDLVASWRPTLVDAASRLPNRARHGEIAAGLPLDRIGPDVAAILCSPELGRIAAGILGSGEIRLIAAAAYLKPPGAAATFWHQDLWFFPLAGEAMTTLWLPLSEVDEQRAPLIVASGSHRGGFVDSSGDAPEGDWPLHRLSPMSLGDVSAHDGWTLHGSGPNRSDRPREAIGLSYLGAGARFASRADLQREPARYERIAPYLDAAGYREGEAIDGPACPAIALS